MLYRFHTNYSSQMVGIVTALMDAGFEAPAHHVVMHSYIYIEPVTKVFGTSSNVARGTPFVHVSLDMSDAVTLLNPEAVVEYLCSFKPTHVRD